MFTWKWLTVNRLTLSSQKNQYMIIRSRQRSGLCENPEIVMNNHMIKRVSDKNVLGIIVHDQLKWNKYHDVQWKRIKLLGISKPSI